MKPNEITVKCVCGAHLRVSETRLKSGRALCPKCKHVLEASDLEAPEASAADTQTINIQEMARMAQEGIEVEISGEWNTLGPQELAKDCEKKE